ncbi:MAG: dicarboxylate/amino acid:cation symporter [Bacteroidetes bacterium]|jgi:proton glutamate symport protein|nr:dicarboxylate/amino acid:cation symporter [Bacteroidota bacterium]MBT5529932.1 dicarboxylate/amino acid:cation symporter [Cytophagia bacterium]MBT3422175.1 dicarboxylate/amino acid:cation symporter [Bacteroidota bacterium]MBT3802694.1 dicarboxylate/amino acid:cation symporter [Bacteroidota bacterium]MBT3933100.1 dicarboxylate/amino acid:cation symporter [Bacteroidota bacterium]
MKKFPLHWQILVALILAVIFGSMFKTNYQITPKAIEKFRDLELPEQMISELEKIQFKNFTEKALFEKTLNEQIGKENVAPYKKVIIRQAYNNDPVRAISWMGDLFLRALKMLIIPLILASIISGVSNIGSADNLGRLGLKTISYYMLTSLLAIITGLLLVNIFQPGVGIDRSLAESVDGLILTDKTLGQTLIEIVPENIFTSFTNSHMLSIIFFAILFGFFISKTSDSHKRILSNFFNALFDIMMKITLFVIKFTPLGIFGIVAKVVSEQADLWGLAQRMGVYMFVVILGLAIHMFATLPLLTRFIGKVRPFKHFNNMSSPLLTAFSTSSSGATLPLTISAVENKSGVSQKVSSFTLPLGATINMDGTALYECVAAIFIAQAYGMDLTIVQQIIIVITALLASIGAAAIPMAGLVMITVILSAIGLPLEGVGLILAVDRILDMFRTSTNVWSDTCGAVIIAKSEKEKLPIDL